MNRDAWIFICIDRQSITSTHYNFFQTSSGKKHYIQRPLFCQDKENFMSGYKNVTQSHFKKSVKTLVLDLKSTILLRLCLNNLFLLKISQLPISNRVFLFISLVSNCVTFNMKNIKHHHFYYFLAQMRSRFCAKKPSDERNFSMEIRPNGCP